MKISDIKTETVKSFAKTSGAREVHRSWRDNMLAQNREVGNKAEWEDLPQRDKELDAQISFDVISDFLVWAESHLLYLDGSGEMLSTNHI